jgi:hypothetical protein
MIITFYIFHNSYIVPLALASLLIIYWLMYALLLDKQKSLV